MEKYPEEDVIRFRILGVLIILAVLNFVFYKRYYPFSNYNLFAYQRVDTTYFTLALRNKDGHITLMNDKSLWPLTRFHMNQMIAAYARSGHGFSGIRAYGDRVQNRDFFKSLLVVRAHYDFAKESSSVEYILYEKDL